MKKKVLVILSSRHYTKYLTLKSFENLDKKFDVYFALKKGSYKKKK